MNNICVQKKQELLPNAILLDESRDWTDLHEAAAAGDEKRLGVLLSSKIKRIGTYNRLPKELIHGNTPLHEAATRGYSRCVKLICSSPPRKLQKIGNKYCKHKMNHTIEALHNSILAIGNNEGFSALHLAVKNGHNQSCRELLLAGADPDVQNNYGDTSLHTACRYGHAGVTRILLSAACDLNKANLNGDTALHITCAMGRRKLTRILIDADALSSVKNCQGETVHDIAVRKQFTEILGILNNPKRIRPRNEKKNVCDASHNQPCQLEFDHMISWSPYGCHYFPDPRTFPRPKLETLPKDPLSSGEQYFLDLAGNIHKGPTSVGNTCYCGPFFRQMENKINFNRQSLEKYIYKTREKLGHKVQALTIKTNGQIEELTRKVIADRIRCENKRIIFDDYLRGERLRFAFGTNTEPNRWHSLEVLDKYCLPPSKLRFSKSTDMLKEESAKFTTNNNNSELQRPKVEELKLDFFTISEHLNSLLEKTNFIMKRDKELDCTRNEIDYGKIDKTIKKSTRFMIPNKQKYNPNSSETSNLSQQSNSWEYEPSSILQQHHAMYQNTCNSDENKTMLQTSIKAVPEEVFKSVRDFKESNFHKFNQLSKNNEHCNNAHASIMSTKCKINDYLLGLSNDALESAAYALPHVTDSTKKSSASPTHIETNLKTLEIMRSGEYRGKSTQCKQKTMHQNIGDTIEKLEIRNCEIKSLRKLNDTHINGLMAQTENTNSKNINEEDTKCFISKTYSSSVCRGQNISYLVNSQIKNSALGQYAVKDHKGILGTSQYISSMVNPTSDIGLYNNQIPIYAYSQEQPSKSRIAFDKYGFIPLIHLTDSSNENIKLTVMARNETISTPPHKYETSQKHLPSCDLLQIKNFQRGSPPKSRSFSNDMELCRLSKSSLV